MEFTTGVVLSLLVVSCWAAPQQNPASNPKSLEDLIKDVFQPADNSSVIPGAGTIADNNKQPNSVNNGGCECVPYYQCQNNTIVDNGIGIIDIRFSGTCDNYLQVCCTPPNILSPVDIVMPKPRARKGCGQSNPLGVSFRITGGKDGESQFGEFPWMVAILKEEPVGNNGAPANVYKCGGALIHPSVVLTSAHCVKTHVATTLKIRAGEWDTQTKNEMYPDQERQVASYVIHERYHAGALHNDFALLRLAHPVELAENVDVVCLPEFNANFDYQRCFASGWGKDVFGKEGQYQVILKKVDLPIVPFDTCQRALRKTRLGGYFKLDRSFVCAGGEAGKDTCKGDGGSPLVCPVIGDPDRFHQVGMVAWGIGCGENRVPGVYANVAFARPWIDSKMTLWGYDSTEYMYQP